MPRFLVPEGLCVISEIVMILLNGAFKVILVPILKRIGTLSGL